MQITKKWLKEKSACTDVYEWSLKVLNNKPMPYDKFLNKLISEDRFDWANWVIVRLMDYDQYVSYAVFAAEQVIDIYEKKYPEDKRPRLAIEAAKKCIGLKCAAAWDARAAAWAAAWDAARAAAWDAAWDAARSAAGDAARAAAVAARAAAWAAAWAAARAAAWDAAWAAAGDAWDAARAAAWAAAYKQMQIKILNYGIKLLKG
jgi:hypothetical protein